MIIVDGKNVRERYWLVLVVIWQRGHGRGVVRSVHRPHSQAMCTGHVHWAQVLRFAHRPRTQAVVKSAHRPRTQAVQIG